MNKLNQYFTNNYKWVEQTAVNLTSKLNKRYLASELISNCYLHLASLDTEPMEDNKIKSIIINYMNMQVIWSNTKIKKTILKDNIQPDSVVKFVNQVDDSLSEEELIEELLEEEFVIQNKINFIHQWLQSARPEDRLLFDIVFNQGYNNSGKLSRHSGLSRTTCYSMISKLKKKITKAYSEQN
jgi:hypothetical protein